GLSLGFIQTKKFDVKVAFENSPYMQETYKKNHPNVEVLGDVSTADYDKIKKKYGAIDVVIGGPPCQGFSNANRQKNNAINQNNMLVKQYIRAICELQPKAFVMENVSMLRSDVHRFYLDETDDLLMKRLSFSMTPTKLVLLEKEYLFDGALEIVQNIEAIEKNLLPEDQYNILNIIYKSSKNKKKFINTLLKYKEKVLCFANTHMHSSGDSHIEKVTLNAFCALYSYFEKKRDLSDIQKYIASAIMMQRMLNRAKEIIDNHLIVDKYEIDENLFAIINSYPVFDYIKLILESHPNNYTINASVLNAAEFGAPQKRMRFVVLGVKNDISPKINIPKGMFTEGNYNTVRDAFSDLENVKPVVNIAEDHGTILPPARELSPLAQMLRDTERLHNHVITNTSDTALERFRALKQGQNFHSLKESLKTNTYTDVSRTQNTIYLRLEYDQPSGTVVNVRKSMWIHPVLHRAVSIREAARLQTFPDSFIFCETKDKQYQQVGNAVPPIMARAIATGIISTLERAERLCYS
ncbi:MAG: DNA cytosine methyltransferase, partial [Mailhella sp.]|nr:DNA cytosine methyltransferase [Mailhella sp.]